MTAITVARVVSSGRRRALVRQVVAQVISALISAPTIVRRLARATGAVLTAAAMVARWLPALVWAFLRWPRVAYSCGLGRMKTVRDKNRIVDIPVMRRWRLSRYGWSVRLSLRYGDSVGTIMDRQDQLEAAWRGKIRISGVPGKPHRLQLVILRREPFRVPVPAPRPMSSTKLEVGRCEDGTPFVVDLSENPHYLCAGATGSGKSGGSAAILAALCQTPDAIVLVDLKWGVSAAPMAPRASVIAETRPAAIRVFKDLLALGVARAERCKAAGVDHVRDLQDRPPEVVVMVDEVAELAIGTDKAEKDECAEAMALLLRAVQLLRFAGIHVFLSGQRFGSSLGSSITTVRAQLTGRICYRVNDAETGGMVVGDIAREAVDAAQAIPPELQGVAVANGGPDGWRLLRMARVSHHELAGIAAATADRRIEWDELMGEVAPLGAEVR